MRNELRAGKNPPTSRSFGLPGPPSINYAYHFAITGEVSHLNSASVTKSEHRGRSGSLPCGSLKRGSPIPLGLMAQRRSHPVQRLNLAWLLETQASQVLFAERKAL